MIDPSLPCWRDHHELLQALPDQRFPEAAALNSLLPANLCNHRGHPIRFVPAETLPVTAYEEHIYRSGEISTRADNWHDLCNALVWARLPRVKVAMNTLHHRQTDPARPHKRGPVRDALTLFDECGVIVASTNGVFLQRLALRDWSVFASRSTWKNDVRLLVSGHAILEKCLAPYKSLTAQTLLIQLDGQTPLSNDKILIRELDAGLSQMMLAGEILRSPACLSPLPLMGIPGWWVDGPQDSAFYDDPGVFRRPSAGFKQAPVHALR